MKHNTEYKFNENITSISSVVNMIHNIGYEEADMRILKMKDGSEHTFITIDDKDYIEVTDLNDALALIINDLSILYHFYCEGYIVEAV